MTKYTNSNSRAETPVAIIGKSSSDLLIQQGMREREVRQFEEEMTGDEMKGMSQHSSWWPNKVENDRLIEMIIKRHQVKTKVSSPFLGGQTNRSKYVKPV